MYVVSKLSPKSNNISVLSIQTSFKVALDILNTYISTKYDLESEVTVYMKNFDRLDIYSTPGYIYGRQLLASFQIVYYPLEVDDEFQFSESDSDVEEEIVEDHVKPVE